MTNAYLAGPMRGIQEFNFPAFDEAAAYLRSTGLSVFSPAEHDADGGFAADGLTGEEDLSTLGFSLRDALAADLKYITETADILVILPGWERSAGVAAEMATAKALGLDLWFYDPEAEDGDRLRTYPLYPTDTAMADVIDEIREDFVENVAGDGGEVRTISSTGGEKGVKPQRYELLPYDALDLVAEHFAAGASKYADHNWRKGYEWAKSFGAMMRHAALHWQGEDRDPELGTYHMAAVAFHALVQLAWMRDLVRYGKFDDRYKPPQDEPPQDEE